MKPTEKNQGTLHILVVEDYYPASIGARSVIKENYPDTEIDFAINGREAIDAVIRQDYDLLFMDVGLPDFSGIEATRQIRQYGKSVPIIALTIHPDVKNCLAAGMQDMISKPLTTEKLHKVMEAYVFCDAGVGCGG